MTGEAPQRWTSEAQVLHELETLNDLSMSLTHQYRKEAREAAEAEAAHKALRAKRILLAKARVGPSGKHMAMNEAEVVAEADDEIADAYQARLVTAALADATKESMRSVRTNQDSLRTAAASHRDQIAGPGWSGKR